MRITLMTLCMVFFIPKIHAGEHKNHTGHPKRPLEIGEEWDNSLQPRPQRPHLLPGNPDHCGESDPHGHEPDNAQNHSKRHIGLFNLLPADVIVKISQHGLMAQQDLRSWAATSRYFSKILWGIPESVIGILEPAPMTLQDFRQLVIDLPHTRFTHLHLVEFLSDRDRMSDVLSAVVLVAQVLPDTRIFDFAIDSTKINVAGVAAVAVAMSRWHNFRTLSLTNTNIGTAGCVALAAGLKDLKGSLINSLDLSDNNIGAEGVHRLGRSAAKHPDYRT